GRDGGSVRNRLPGLLQLLDFREHVVERALHGIEAGVREVAEVAFGGGTRDLELRGLAANLLHGAARVTNDGVLLVDADAQRGGGLVGGPQVLAQCVEGANAVVEGAFALANAAEQPLAARTRLLQLARARSDSLLELAGALLEPHHFARQGGAALHQRGVRGARLGGARRQLRDRFTRGRQTALRLAEPLLGVPLLLLQPSD